MKTILRTALLALTLVVAPVVPSFAGPYEDGLAAYEHGDYATALKLWRPLAEQGDANAQANLGELFANGLGVPQNYAEAVNWWRKAAEQGHAVAQSNLGLMYDNGLGVAQDQAEAVKWYRKAAERGYAGAQFNLGVMCLAPYVWATNLRFLY